ncbi:SAV_2336 N-terminal domain-related protein [Streptomyces sp. NPDC004667]|uniref:SAV_2336 N-terminal domain-related protein n=1 Tax=Streptomyces sp. NPDC004667 TaxID=3154285 RepID=UPI0033A3B5CB
MIERLLAAFGEGAGDGAAPRTTVGAEEIADILWLAARVDAAAPPPRPQDGPAAGAGPVPDPPPPPGAPAPAPGPTGAADAGAVRLYPATAPAAPADTAPPAHGPVPGTGGRRGVPLRLPRTASLDDPLALMRSLRPVGRRSIGGPGEELDEQLTVERSIESMVPTPVLRPAESRWLDLALVVDTHHSMLLWSDLVAELRAVLTRSGVFRDVRTWQLGGTGAGGTPVLGRSRGGPPRNPLELVDPAGRRLILVVSDTVADGWRQAPLRAVLRHWSTHNAVAVLNVLPERLWNRGAVRPVPFAVRCDRPAAATRSWQRIPAARRARGGGPVVPVVGIASGSLARLVRVVSGDGRWRRLACLRLDSEPPPAAAPAAGLTPLEAVERFRAAASPTAQQLAAHLAAVPLTLPVMTLVRRSLPVGSEHGHLAEVALGGLFAPWDAEHPADETEFEFLPGVRDVLLGSQLRGDVAAVRELVRLRVWEYLSRHRGTGPDFSATRVTDGTEGRRRVPDAALPFAERPRTEPGLAHRVVRVRFEPSPEPREVGTLLGPRTVLTAGEVPRPGEALAWVRAGGREVACRPVWWDDARPRVLLLESEEDLADPETLPRQDWTGGPGAALVEGVTDQGVPVALRGEVAADGGARNGELVRLSAEPEEWTHLRGGPVSSNGALVGVVHTVLPDRVVFLAGTTLLEEEGFRAALGGTRPPVDPDDSGLRVTLTVRVGEGIRPSGASPRRQLADFLSGLMAETGVNGRLSGGVKHEETLSVIVDAPGALVQAGRLLGGLLYFWALGRVPWTGGDAPRLALALDIGGADGPVDDAEELLGHDRVRAYLRGVSSQGFLLTLSPHLHEHLAEQLGLRALRDLEPLTRGAVGWLYHGDPSQLADLMEQAETARRETDSWPRCGLGASPERPSGCAGILVPGHSHCLAHLAPAALNAYLRTLGPGSSVDFRGTLFAGGLLDRLLEVVRDRDTGRVRLGSAAFTGALFEDVWEAERAEFEGYADFVRAVFAGGARFEGTGFHGETTFRRAVFEGRAGFAGSRFSDTADFGATVFVREADFTAVVWEQEVAFRNAVAEGPAGLGGMSAHEGADFTGMLFKGRAELGASVFAQRVHFVHAVWEGELSAVGTQFHGLVFEHAVVRGRAVFANAAFDGPTTFTHGVFEHEATFSSCDFGDPAIFAHAVFEGPVTFKDVGFHGGVSFDHVTFSGEFRWSLTQVEGGGADFGGTVFHGRAAFEESFFLSGTALDGATFEGPLTFEATRFDEVLDLRVATFNGSVSFADVTLAQPTELPPHWSATHAEGGWRMAVEGPAHRAAAPEADDSGGN